jgi:hypothetical protein
MRAGVACPHHSTFDTLGTLTYIMESGFDYSWFILTRRIIAKEFALSGSEQNPDLTGKSWGGVLMRATEGVPAPLRAFMEKGEDFIVEPELPTLVKRMNALTGDNLLTVAGVEREIRARPADRQPFSKDMQVTALRGARRYLGDRLIRTVPRTRSSMPRRGRSSRCGSTFSRARRWAASRPISTAACSARTARPCRDCMRRVRQPVSAAEACMATARSKEPSLAAASSQGAPLDGLLLHQSVNRPSTCAAARLQLQR